MQHSLAKYGTRHRAFDRRQPRLAAFEMMVAHAEEQGVNAIMGMNFITQSTC
jgi:uncharacterized protein YbjQ (UPF0145 family)